MTTNPSSSLASSTEYEQIGKPLGRAEGPEKVTGQAIYPADVRLPGMLAAKALRSTVPHARIVSIDATAAAALPGVHAVLTAADLPDLMVGRFLRDVPLLARDRVLFTGQKVAVVAADNLDIADEALALIKVEYEDLPALFTVDDAVSASAPVLHPDFDDYVGATEGRAHPNVVATNRWGKGDVDAGFAAADRVFEHTFTTQRQHQGYIEPHACVVHIDDTGRVQTWVNSKAPFQLRQQLAEGIDVDEDQVVINPSFIGGDFGGKGGPMDTHLAYWLAKRTGRPVRMTMNYNEELIAGNPRHGGKFIFKTGVTKDGDIVARSARLLFDSGAFGGFRRGKGSTYGPRCLGPYRMQHSAIESSVIYTNQVPCGSMRSPGDPQSIFASEAHLDLVARELGMSGYEFRRRNIVAPGEENALGGSWRAPTAAALLERAATESGYHEPRRQVPGKKVGIGLALSDRGTGGGPGNARVRIDTDGTVSVAVSIRDTGAGAYTMLRQIVGETLGVDYNSIELTTWDTDQLATDGGVGGARITNAAGNAALEAATQVRSALAGFLANRNGWDPEEIQFTRAGIVVGSASAKDAPATNLTAVMSQYGEAVEAQVSRTAPATPDETVFTAQAAEVEVDEDTGQITVTRFTTVHDVGTIINPIAHQGQIDGTVVQGLGFTLMEELIYEDGFVTNAHLGDYKLPTMRDLPELNTVLVRAAEDGPAPFGAKGIGEQAISGVAPAIVNALLDATGESFPDLPVTAEKVFNRLHGVD